MASSIITVCFQGIRALPVDVQVHVTPGVPQFVVVGLADKAVSEARERVRSALHTIGLALPSQRIIVNLSPANIQKEGSHYDLPIALGLMSALGALPLLDGGSVVLGELALDGSIVAVGGALSAGLFALENGRKLICPKACGSEAAWAGDITILASCHLLELVRSLRGEVILPAPTREWQDRTPSWGDFQEIRGQDHAKRALEIAMAGAHNILMQGPPGAGKSMLASRAASLLPEPTPEEALEITMIHSLSATAYGCEKLWRHRPFRSPHHSASMVSLIGGGIKGVPGEVSLAHGGILFLDELPEFSRNALEALRQPLESGMAVISRANAHISYPARFQLIAAMNPCRCGYMGNAQKACRKAPSCGETYRSRLSGPLLDRIDMYLEVPALSVKDFAQHPGGGEKSASIAQRVAKARARQMERYGEVKENASSNSQLLNGNVEERLFETKILYETGALEMLTKAAERLGLSMRGFRKVSRVAQTIADLEEAEWVSCNNVLEALSFRYGAL